MRTRTRTRTRTRGERNGNNTKGHKGTEEDRKGQHFWSFFLGDEPALGWLYCKGNDRNYTKTHKCTTFPQLFFSVPVSTGEGLTGAGSDLIVPNRTLGNFLYESAGAVQDCRDGCPWKHTGPNPGLGRTPVSRDTCAITKGENKNCVQRHPA